MSKYLSGIAAAALIGATTFALPAAAADRQGSAVQTHQSTEMSSQHRQGARHWRGGRVYAHRHWGPRRHYWGPRPYAYWGPRPYAYYDPYPYYRPGPFVSFGVGPFGFWF
jgi:hypothetical protein